MLLYDTVIPGRFIARPNRFIARVETAAGEEICHVKNTGRCRELLVPGVEVVLAVSDNPARKTRCDLVAVYKGERLINMDSQAPNRVAAEGLPRLIPGLALLRPETRFGDSRLDFYWEAGERRGFVEVKGVTLEEDGHARFPDAPTERGVKHLHELMRAVAEGHRATVFFVLQMAGMTDFAPNDDTHPAFGAALRQAAEAGVNVAAYSCRVTPDTLGIDRPVPVIL